jgi:hypothetical protein
VLRTAGTEPADHPVSIPPRRPGVLVGVAAAVLVLATAIGVPLARSGSGTSASSSASRAVRQPSGSQHQASASQAGGLSKDVTTTVSNLGTVNSVSALRGRLVSLLPAASPAPSGQAAGNSGTGSGSGFSAQAAPQTTSAFEQCLSSALHAAGPTRTVQRLATATFKGVPALVYVFGSEPGAGPASTGTGRVVVVTARSGCTALATASS